MPGCLAGSQYIPSVEFFAHWLQHEVMILEAHEHFQKRSWRNKTAIQGPDQPLFLSVPLKKGKNNQMPIREVEISYDEPWHRIHFNSIETAYGKTSFYDEIRPDIDKILSSHQEKLWDLNLELIQLIIHLIPGNWTFTLTGNYEPVLADDVMDLRSGVPSGETNIPHDDLPTYPQIHRLTKSHLPNLSILDALCHLGPDTKDYIVRYSNQLYQ